MILANSRPYEGLLICLPAGLLLARWMLRSSQVPLPAKLRLVVVPACIVFVAGGLCMGIYNRAVTGSFTKTPYDVHVRQYWQRGVFVFDRVHQPERTPPDRVAMFYREHETPPESGAALRRTLTQNLSSRLFGLAGTPFGVAYLSPDPGYQGLLLWLALLVSVWRSLSIGATAAAVLFAVGLECLAWKFVPFYPRVLILSLVTCWAAAFYLSARRNPSARFIVGRDRRAGAWTIADALVVAALRRSCPSLASGYSRLYASEDRPPFARLCNPSRRRRHGLPLHRPRLDAGPGCQRAWQ